MSPTRSTSIAFPTSAEFETSIIDAMRCYSFNCRRSSLSQSKLSMLKPPLYECNDELFDDEESVPHSCTESADMMDPISVLALGLPARLF